MTAVLMNALLPPPRQNSGLPELVREIGIPANDDSYRSTGAINGPETVLIVEFVGIDENQQRIALASFPSARRFSIVQ